MRRRVYARQIATGFLVAPLLALELGCAPSVAESVGAGGASASSTMSSTASSSSQSSTGGGPGSSSSSTGGGNVRCDPATTDAVAFQINAQHTGAQLDSTFVPPLLKRWSVDLGGAVSYPLIAGGRVFVTVAAGEHNGTTLVALDLVTGTVVWGPIAIPSTLQWSNAAYDDGQVFVTDDDGLLQAFDAETGTVSWSFTLSTMGGPLVNSPPTAFAGVVYVSGDGFLDALDEESGALLWTTTIFNGNGSAPVIGDDAVFGAYFPEEMYRFAAQTGAEVWEHLGNQPENSTGGATPALCGGLLFTRGATDLLDGLILDTEDGAVRGTFPRGGTPAFSGTQSFFSSAGKLHARDIETMNPAWSFAGDGNLVSAPIVVGSNVYIGSTSGMLYALDAATGQDIWSDDVGAPIAATREPSAIAPLTGFAEADGFLVVPATNTLVAYSP